MAFSRYIGSTFLPVPDGSITFDFQDTNVVKLGRISCPQADIGQGSMITQIGGQPFCYLCCMPNLNLNTEKNDLTPLDKEFENNIRPAAIEEFSGQPQLIENLKVFIK